MSGQHCESYDVKRETVHCYPVNSSLFLGKQNSLFPSGPVIKCLLLNVLGHVLAGNVIQFLSVVSIQSRFDTSRFDTNQSRFDTHVKLFRYTSKVVSIQTEVNSIQPLFTLTIVLIC